MNYFGTLVWKGKKKKISLIFGIWFWTSVLFRWSICFKCKFNTVLIIVGWMQIQHCLYFRLQSVSVNLWNFFSIFALLHLLLFHVNFRIICFSKRTYWSLKRNCFEYVRHFRENEPLNNIKSFNQWALLISLLFRSSY